MFKRITASDAKNNFGGLLEDVAALGRVDIFKHGRLVAVLLSPRALETMTVDAGERTLPKADDSKHMISGARARAARMRAEPRGFDE
jgi:prevent-host-death family protein